MPVNSSWPIEMRKSERLFVLLGVLFALMLVSGLDGHVRAAGEGARLETMRRQVAAFDLTDLSLFTEARYIRHLSQADRHSPFQDHPLSLEHFPTGSLILPPEALR